MKHGIIFATVALLLLSYSCSADYGVSGALTRTVASPSQSDADMIVERFTFDEISARERGVSFSADRAFYYEGEKLLFLKNVSGDFSYPSGKFSFFLPEAVYDREHNQLVALSKVSISTASGFSVRSEGGVLDLEKNEVSLERNVVITTSSMEIRGETGQVDLSSGTVRLRIVEGEIRSLGGVREDIREVIK